MRALALTLTQPDPNPNPNPNPNPDPDFWRKVLGDEPEAQGEEADDMAHGLVGRLSRRNRDAPDRFDPSLDSALSAGYHPPGAAGAAAHADGAPAAAAWTRAQLQAPCARG